MTYVNLHSAVLPLLNILWLYHTAAYNFCVLYMYQIFDGEKRTFFYSGELPPHVKKIQQILNNFKNVVYLSVKFI